MWKSMSSPVVGSRFGCRRGSSGVVSSPSSRRQGSSSETRTHVCRRPLLHPADHALPEPGLAVVALEAPEPDRVERRQRDPGQGPALARRKSSTVVPQDRRVGDREVAQGRVGEEGEEGEEDGAEDREEDEREGPDRADERRYGGEYGRLEAEGVRGEVDVGEDVAIDEGRDELPLTGRRSRLLEVDAREHAVTVELRVYMSQLLPSRRGGNRCQSERDAPSGTPALRRRASTRREQVLHRCGRTCC